MSAENIDVTEAKVTYTTKELLTRIDARFERLEGLVTNRPTRAEFVRVESRLATVEEEQTGIRAATLALKEDKTSRFNRTDKLVIGVFALITTLLNLSALGPDILG